MKLYPHQTAMVDAALAAYADGIHRAVAVMATGGGKTIAGVNLATHLAPPSSSQRVLWLVHQKELAYQALQAFRLAYPITHIGLVQGEYHEPTAQVVVGLVQSLAQPHRRHDLKRYGAFDFLVIDECHHAPARRYREVMQDLLSPTGLALGLTATPGRADGVSLATIFEEIVYCKGMLDLMVEINPDTGQPFLADLRPPITIMTDTKVKHVALTRGEFHQAQLAAAVHQSLNRWERGAIAYQQFGAPERRKALVFAVDRSDAYHFHEALHREGARSAVVLGSTPREERLKIMGDPLHNVPGMLERDQLDALIGVGVFMEGVDLPIVSMGIDGRMPQSPWTLQQMVGRVVRAYPGKRDAVWVSLAPSDHSLVTIDAFVGSDRPLTTSVRTYLTEKVKTAHVEHDPLGELAKEETVYTLQATTREAFTVPRPVGTWRRDAFSRTLLLETTVGIYTLKPFGTAYDVTRISPGGRTERLVQTPVARHLAVAYAEVDADTRLRREARRNAPSTLAGPVTAETLALTKKMRLRNVRPEMTEEQVRKIIARVKPKLKKTAAH